MKKGFTLIELLGVLLVIGVLSLVLVPTVSNVIKNQKTKQYDQQIQNIELAAKNFGTDNLVILPTEEKEYIYINIGQLKAMGYLEEQIINPITDEQISDCARIKITKTGNAHNYDYQKETENIVECNSQNGSIIISDPTDKYIRDNEISSYIITIAEKIEKEFVVKYEVDKNKMYLTGNTDAIYTVVEGHGVYKVIVKGGKIEGTVNLKLESRAITKNEIEDLIGTNGIQSDESIIIDNTTPEITFGTNGSDWTKNSSSTITVSDNLSGGVEKSYKYIYTTDYEIDVPTLLFRNGESYSISNVTGNYYLFASACDRSGNCTTKVSNMFKLDNTSPVIAFGTNGNNNWSKTASSTISVTDNNSGGNSNTYKYVYSTSETATPSIQFASGSSYRQNSGDGSYYLIATACDKVGNCTTKVSDVFKLDNTAPTITFGTNGNSNWSKTASSTINVTDESSGVKTDTYKYIYSTSKTATPTTKFESGKLYSQNSGNGSYYLRAYACDTLGNCTTQTSNEFKLDNTKPTISYSKCTPNSGYTKCLSVTGNDSSNSILKLYRAHCSQTDTGDNQYCGKISARDRVDYYYNHNGTQWYPGDNKATLNTFSSGKSNKLNTQFGKQTIISFAFVLCDSAGNCVEGDYSH